jgi:hypothetical protein
MECLLSDMTGPVDGGVRQSVAGKIHGKQPAAREGAEQGRPGGGAQRHTVEQNERWAAAVGKHSHAPPGLPERQKELLDLYAESGEQIGLGTLYALLKSHTNVLT